MENSNRVFVLDHDKTPLMPCKPKRARLLLSSGQAAVFRRYPFTIILKRPASAQNKQPLVYQVDSGSKQTGLALNLHGKNTTKTVWGTTLHHRTNISDGLTKRAAARRARRFRKTRYRPARFLNRLNRKDKLPPSVQAKADNVVNWFKRLSRLTALSGTTVEVAKFDTQKLINPDISGIEYQQGKLFNYVNVRQYLLERDGRKCVYCGSTGSADNRFELDHVVPRSKGGSDRVGNLVLACHKCNQAKGNKSLNEFVSPAKSRAIKAKLSQPLADASHVTTLRRFMVNALKALTAVKISNGAVTATNRKLQQLPKAHWIDAAVAGKQGATVLVNPTMATFHIKATGRGCRQMCRMDKYGFPRTSAKARTKNYFGFTTGDMVRAVVSSGKYKGSYMGRISVRKSGYFDIKTKGGKINVSYKYCKPVHKSDGYEYMHSSPT